MLPAADLLSKCLRCHAPLAFNDTTCPACGADPAVERAVYQRITAAIARMRQVFGFAIAATFAGAVLVHGHRSGGASVYWPALVGCGVLGVLWLGSSRAPVLCAVAGLALFAVSSLALIAVAPRMPALELAVRACVMLALGFALHQALVARRLREQRG
jgi:hypothetical protein